MPGGAPEQVCPCHAADVLSQPAYMLFYTRRQPRPSLPDLARRAAALASSSAQAGQPQQQPAPPHSAPAVRRAGSPAPSGPHSLPDRDPIIAEAPEEVVHAGSGSSANDGDGAERGVEGYPERRVGLHLQDMRRVKEPVASVAGSAHLVSQELGVLEGRGLCRGEPAADELPMPLHLAKAH